MNDALFVGQLERRAELGDYLTRLGQVDRAAMEIQAEKTIRESRSRIMGGEDFAWYLTHCPGALVRMGTRTPGGITYDIHQGDLLIDEGSVPIAARIFTATALKVLDGRREALQPAG